MSSTWTLILAQTPLTTSFVPLRFACTTSSDVFLLFLKCHCQPRIPIRPRNRDAQTRRDSEGGRGRDDVSQEAGRAIHKDQRCVHPSPAFPSILTRSRLESTNQRVQNFGWFTILSLAGLGVWQIFHLRAFFKRKYLID